MEEKRAEGKGRGKRYGVVIITIGVFLSLAGQVGIVILSYSIARLLTSPQ